MSLGSLASKPLSAALFLAALAAVTLYIFVLDPAARPLIDFDVYLQEESGFRSHQATA